MNMNIYNVDLFTNTIPVNNSTVLNFVGYTSLLGFSFFLSFVIDYLRFVTAHVMQNIKMILLIL
ncbi:hypothetical protein PFFCH_04807 [Plasmodium falciparum FCH/4]|uniref:Uncharacterized protein n=1 Tax=Plasmodium falciparum FCH/4 TaxID=1036724 RepID=A0A024VIU9_PLAFA|nr:hypothetical protein PFFCH_04807 [Plasmodium falciparum FCH/4]